MSRKKVKRDAAKAAKSDHRKIESSNAMSQGSHSDLVENRHFGLENSDMEVTDVDRLVIATLAGAKAAAEKKELPGHFLSEYEKMLAVFLRRQKARADRKVQLARSE